MSRGKKKKTNRGFLVIAILIFVVLVLTILYFCIFNDNDKKKLIKIGYNDKEINKLMEKLSDDDIKKIYSYDYLSFLSDLIYLKDYKQENMVLYIDYINKIEGEYDLESVVYLVNSNIDYKLIESLVGIKDYNQENIISYIDYINKIEGDYDLESVVYLVNSNINYPYSKKLSDLVKSKYFISSRLDRYMKYDSSDINAIITNVNSNLDYKFYTNINKTDTSKETLLIVNKYYNLDKNYYYGDLVVMDKRYDNKSGSKLSKVAYEAFKKLVDDAEKKGYYIRNNSAYRSYDYQNSLYNNYKNKNGLAWADKWSARPGHSEHQTGLALDVGVKGQLSLDSFEVSKEFTWMKDNAHHYGFILRYPKGKEYITGYGYEPWHYRYVGVDVATYIYENNITYEEYYAYFVENKV